MGRSHQVLGLNRKILFRDEDGLVRKEAFKFLTMRANIFESANKIIGIMMDTVGYCCHRFQNKLYRVVAAFFQFYNKINVVINGGRIALRMYVLTIS